MRLNFPQKPVTNHLFLSQRQMRPEYGNIMPHTENSDLS
ncbi:hypothetical protein NBRC3257_1988 [Gluconobacter thailandicus NBRC 3257]|uniref:Transposase n=1 Tax=Gluconobacter thailandicus NBRC 3257 TaxID=1381097 RepID=A0ABQ0IXQ5_GLUTH|nr:hypothetical protein B932_0366 [Gluconobacter oxydans H24]GAC87409.1 hypothetical protein NBRC3255_1070 [Gluconobacter thailandicus NBRC 3255]GAD26989.1 hypothetical protein NBRC3257_1988 [Gluconobacter thailandicus NBRC 3257]